MRIRNYLLIITYLVFTTCPAYAGGTASGNAAEPDELVSIFEALETRPGDAAATDALTRYVDVNSPTGRKYVDEALLRLARLQAAEKNYAAASQNLQQLLTYYPASRVKFEALFDLANIRRMQGADTDSRSLLEAVVMSADAPIALQAHARLLLKQANTNSGAAASGQALTPLTNITPSIGALLPLKGSYANYGNDALKGILLAANTFTQAGSPIEVVVRDVDQTGESAVSAVNDLAANPHVAGLVGPLLSASAIDAAKTAQEKKLPIITLSQREGILSAGNYVYRNFLTPQIQAAYLAEYACKVMGKKSFVIVFPQNNYGAELAKDFSVEALRQGCSIAGQASYQPGATDFSHALSQAFKIKVKETKVGRKVIKEYTAQVKADALYMPDSLEAASLLAPYLQYFDISGVQLLGSNAWNSPGLAESAYKYMDGAVFVDGFFAESERPDTKAFTTKFREVYGASPGMIEAYSYDAAMMLIASMTTAGVGSDRAALNDRLRAIADFHGATGSLSLESNGEVSRRLFILTLKSGQITEINMDKQPDQVVETIKR